MKENSDIKLNIDQMIRNIHRNDNLMNNVEIILDTNTKLLMESEVRYEL
jgi:hypothetical protein